MPKPPATPKPIRGRLQMVSAQREQYKPYNYIIEFDGVYVEIPLETNEYTVEDDKIILNLDGFKAVLTVLADAVEQVHNAYIIKARKAGTY